MCTVGQRLSPTATTSGRNCTRWGAASRGGRAVRLNGVLALAKLAGTDQRYHLDQADRRVDHAGSVSSGAEGYYLGGPEAAGRWTGSASRLLGLAGEAGAAPLRAVLSQQVPRTGRKLDGPAARAPA